MKCARIQKGIERSSWGRVEHGWFYNLAPWIQRQISVNIWMDLKVVSVIKDGRSRSESCRSWLYLDGGGDGGDGGDGRGGGGGGDDGGDGGDGRDGRDGGGGGDDGGGGCGGSSWANRNIKFPLLLSQVHGSMILLESRYQLDCDP